MTTAFAKNKNDEMFLDELNQSLRGLESQQRKEYQERFPTVHVLGVPRSGTTLLIQLLASTLGVGYINNLIAAFWRAPVCGIRLSKKLLQARPVSDLRSSYGQTTAIQEPHEFGYFWAEHLRIRELREPTADHAESIDWGHLQQTVFNMCEAFGRPIVFKSFLAGWFVEEMAKHFSRALFVYVSRDLVDCAISLLRMRETTLGSKEHWTSLKPKQYEWLEKEPYWIQVAGQTYYLEKAFTDALSRLPSDMTIQVDLQDLRSDPEHTLANIVERMEAKGFSAERLCDVDRELIGESYDVADHPDYSRVKEAVTRFRNGHFDSDR